MRSTASDALIVIGLSGHGHSRLALTTLALTTLALLLEASRNAVARSPPPPPAGPRIHIASKESDQWHG
jgi:hypothetical protein